MESERRDRAERCSVIVRLVSTTRLNEDMIGFRYIPAACIINSVEVENLTSYLACTSKYSTL
jgi:hypothetical protein